MIFLTFFSLSNFEPRTKSFLLFIYMAFLRHSFREQVKFSRP